MFHPWLIFPVFSCAHQSPQSYSHNRPPTYRGTPFPRQSWCSEIPLVWWVLSYFLLVRFRCPSQVQSLLRWAGSMFESAEKISFSLLGITICPWQVVSTMSSTLSSSVLNLPSVPKKKFQSCEEQVTLHIDNCMSAFSQVKIQIKLFHSGFHLFLILICCIACHMQVTRPTWNHLWNSKYFNEFSLKQI